MKKSRPPQQPNQRKNPSQEGEQQIDYAGTPSALPPVFSGDALSIAILRPALLPFAGRRISVAFPCDLCAEGLYLSQIFRRLCPVPSALNLLTYSSKHNDTIPMPKPKKTNPEIEIKLRIKEIPKILRKIRSLSVQSRPRVQEQNTLYDTPQSHLRRRDMLLRLRIETPARHNARSTRHERVILTAKATPHQPHTHKHPPRYKIRAEREQIVRKTSLQWAAALASLGFRPTFRYDKFRTTFRLPNLHVDLDETPAGTFLELEGKPQAIDRAAAALGFSKQAYLRSTYWDLYVADCRRRRVTPKNMLFRAK
jgi:adenylate cyclase class 2